MKKNRVFTTHYLLYAIIGIIIILARYKVINNFKIFIETRTDLWQRGRKKKLKIIKLSQHATLVKEFEYVWRLFSRRVTFLRFETTNKKKIDNFRIIHRHIKTLVIKPLNHFIRITQKVQNSIMSLQVKRYKLEIFYKSSQQQWIHTIFKENLSSKIMIIKTFLFFIRFITQYISVFCCDDDWDTKSGHSL